MMRQLAIKRIEARKEHQKENDFSLNIKRCKRCGRLLTSKYSQERLLGYKCWKLLQHEKSYNNIIWSTREVTFQTAYDLLKEQEALVKPFNKDELFQHE